MHIFYCNFQLSNETFNIDLMLINNPFVLFYSTILKNITNYSTVYSLKLKQMDKIIFFFTESFGMDFNMKYFTACQFLSK